MKIMPGKEYLKQCKSKSSRIYCETVWFRSNKTNKNEQTTNTCRYKSYASSKCR